MYFFSYQGVDGHGRPGPGRLGPGRQRLHHRQPAASTWPSRSTAGTTCSGKCLAVGVFVNLMTTLPALVLFAQHGLDDWDYFTNPDYFAQTGTGKRPGELAAAARHPRLRLVLTVFLSLLLVATASWLRRTVPLIMVWTTLFLFLRLLAEHAGGRPEVRRALAAASTCGTTCTWSGSGCLGFRRYTMGRRRRSRRSWKRPWSLSE